MSETLTNQSYVKNCVLKTRGETLFHVDGGKFIAQLDGYAILPVEEYQVLIADRARAFPNV